MMRYSNIQVVFQEVPGEITICFSITGCLLNCKGCHSPFLWKEGSGTLLTNSIYLKTLKKYQNLASCVLFMGGEWHQDELIHFLKTAIKLGYKTCLYTGLDSVPLKVHTHLTWLKTGKWDLNLGGLKNTQTNQKFTEVNSGKILNNLFKNN